MARRAKIDFITIAVSDLAGSIAFYTEVFGFATEGVKQGNEDHCLFALEDDFSLVLFQREAYLPLTANPAPRERSAGFMLSHAAPSRQEVDALLERALALGASPVGEPTLEAWGYSVRFTDPDGHHWEVLSPPD